MGHSIFRLRIDNDYVFLCFEFTALCELEGISVERTVPYAHWQLGRIERQWRTLTHFIFSIDALIQIHEINTQAIPENSPSSKD